MTRVSGRDVNAVGLSLLLPGLAQLEQGRRMTGSLLLVWTTPSFIALVVAPAFGLARAPFWVELVLLTTWAGVDALRHRAATH